MLPFAVCACLVGADSARAQDADYAPASEAHRAGRWSMQFQVVDDFRLAGFENAGLAMTRNTGENSAWRFGVQLSGQSWGGEFTRTVTTDSTSVEETRPIDQDRFSVHIDLLRLRRFHPARRVGLELGVGPSVQFERFRDESENANPSYTTHNESRASVSRYGLAGRFGVEVFLARDLSVHAHYGASAGYMQETSTQHSSISYVTGQTGESTFEAQRRQWFFEDVGVGLGISLYL
jgi:hypothetical protein